MKKIIVSIVILALMLSLTACGNKRGNATPEEENNETETEGDANAEFESEPIDVGAYLEEIGEVKEVVPNDGSADVKSDTYVMDTLNERGFGMFPLTAEYTMDGEYLGEEIMHPDDTKYPFYETYYTSTTGEIWTINIIAGTITAFPVTYNIESERNVGVIISETSELTSYDYVTNKFYSFVPDKDLLIIAVVEKIDAQTLNGLTNEEMDRY